MEPNTRSRLLNHAEHLIRTRGYADFSYADLAMEIGIRKASIHHHFPTKEDLGAAVVEDYIERFKERLQAIERDQSRPLDRLRTYAGLFDAEPDRSLPLCGALAAELAALPPRMKSQTKQFFQLHLEWLTKVVQEGRVRATHTAASDAEIASWLLSTLEGGSLVSWATGDVTHVLTGFNIALGALRARP